MIKKEKDKFVGIQISPMRDALHKLSAEGLVQITPRKGIQVTPSSIKIIFVILIQSYPFQIFSYHL